MFRRPAFTRGRAIALAAGIAIGSLLAGCGAIPFDERPASGYAWGSGAPLRVAIIDQSSAEWAPALGTAVGMYREGAGGKLDFQAHADGANIVITVRSYTDASPPDLRGYDFPMGAGGFATIYDAEGKACNYPPSPLPLNCSGEITTTEIWLNQGIPAGGDIESRRVRLITHELGHALGLTRHSPDMDIGSLAQRYGW